MNQHRTSGVFGSTTYDESVPATSPDVIQSFKDSWALVSGAKGSFWGAFLLGVLIAAAIGLVEGLFLVLAGEGLSVVASLFFTVVSSVWNLIFTTGLLFIGIRRARSQPIQFNMIFEFFSKAWPLLVLGILTFLAAALGFFLLIIPGIYLMVSYLFSIPILIERNCGAWEAMEMSRKTVTKHWFSYFGYSLLALMVLVGSVFCLLIPLIWTLPWLYITYGTLYKKAFA